ncbi:MAG: hypothetical protein N4A71_08000 [Carboxylicivirga sp.]|jgi:hypothetical protein|nr:hypothetical protein [Carboxylicivirga sp.]
MKQKYYLAVITYVKTLLLSKLRNNQFNNELVNFIRCIPDEQIDKFNLEHSEFIKLVKKKYRTHTNYFSNLINVLFLALDGNFLVSYNYIHCDYIIEELYDLYSTSDFKKACCHFSNIINHIDEENYGWLCNILNDLDLKSNFTSKQINSLGQLAISRLGTPSIVRNVAIRYYLSNQFKKSAKYLYDYLGMIEQLEIKSVQLVSDYIMAAEMFLKSDNTAMTFVHIRKGLELADEVKVIDCDFRNHAYILLIKGYTKKLGEFTGKRKVFLKEFSRVKNKLKQTIDWDNASSEVFSEMRYFEELESWE